jgi:hypothetical protein
MKARIAAALALLFAADPALAATTGGNAALSLAALVGLQSPLLSGTGKTVLTKYLDGHADVIFKKGKTIVVKADAVNLSHQQRRYYRP